MRSTITLPC